MFDKDKYITERKNALKKDLTKSFKNVVKEEQLASLMVDLFVSLSEFALELEKHKVKLSEIDVNQMLRNELAKANLDSGLTESFVDFFNVLLMEMLGKA